MTEHMAEDADFGRPERDQCGCKPGTHDEGWQERRSMACEQAELNGWREMLARYRANYGVVTPPGEGS